MPIIYPVHQYNPVNPVLLGALCDFFSFRGLCVEFTRVKLQPFASPIQVINQVILKSFNHGSGIGGFGMCTNCYSPAKFSLG